MCDLGREHRRVRCAALASILTFALAAVGGGGCTFVVPFDDPVCGDGVADGEQLSDSRPGETVTEECDGADLRGRTCHEMSGFTGGTLGCSATCRYDISQCWTLEDDRCDFELGESATNSHHDCAWVKVVAGLGHTCGLLADGTALCWGLNENGQLGTGGTENALRPARVAGDIVFTDLFAYGYHTCGLDTESRSWCWGSNRFGQLGIGEVTEAHEPQLLTSPDRVQTLAMGFGNTCFVTPEAGAVLCTGTNGEGQLGTGTTTAPELCDGFPCTREPLLLQYFQQGDRIAMGNFSVCVFQKNDDLWCWGWDPGGPFESGQGYSIPLAPYLAQADSDILELVFGSTVTCARELNLTMCWGAEDRGQLGDPGCSHPASGYCVPALPSPAGSIAVGDEFACATAGESNVYCWGDNFYGQLGQGQPGGFSATPAPIPAFTGAQKLAAGPYHACVIKDDSTLWCWGRSSSGQVGVGSTEEGVAAPVQVIPGQAE